MTDKRLNKILSPLFSRRKADDLIAAGRVTVNGNVATLGQLVDASQDQIAIDGKFISVEEEEKVTYLFHKPIGYLCSAARIKPTDKLIFELLPEGKRLFSVGRLDKDTSGLLFVTNDGAFARSMIHPSENIEKEYHLSIRRPLMREQLHALQRGIFFDGVPLVPKRIKELSPTSLLITIMEGKNREIRRMCESARVDIKTLCRIRIGSHRLPKELAPGEYQQFLR